VSWRNPVDAAFARTADAAYRETVAAGLCLRSSELEHERGYGAQLARQVKSGARCSPKQPSGIMLAATAYVALPAFGLAAAGWLVRSHSPASQPKSSASGRAGEAETGQQVPVFCRGGAPPG